MRVHARYIIKLVFTVTVIVVVVNSLQGESVLTYLSAADIRFVFIALVSFIAAILVNTYRLKLLLIRGSSVLAYSQLLKINFIGLFFSVFLPGRTAGDVVRAYYLTRTTTGIDNAVPALLIWRLIGGLTMISVAFAAAVISYPVLNQIDLIYYSVAMLIVVIAALGFALKPQLASSLFLSLRLNRNRFFTDSIAAMLTKVRDSLSEMSNERKLLFNNALISFCSNFLILLTWIMVSRSVSTEIPFYYILLLIPLVSLLQMIPVSFNGIGVREVATIYLFSAVGVVHEISFTIAILFSTVSVVVSLAGGIVYLTYKHRYLPLLKTNREVGNKSEDIGIMSEITGKD